MLHFKNIFSSLLLLFFLVNAAQSQNSDRFIRVVGNAKKEYVSNRAVLIFTVSEVQPNEYRQVRYKSVDAVFQDLSAAIKQAGFNASSLVKDDSNPLASGYQSTVRSERYRFTLDNLSKLSEATGIVAEGAKLTEVKYQYDVPGIAAEDDLARNAMNDAERKAEKLAKEAGKKIGKILNIEDRSSGCCREIEEAIRPTIIHNYKVNVTYELVD